jgi:CubicO group peptidase (beta-lactamase class C family)
MFPPNKTISEAADSLARIPAAHQPGAAFTYGFSTDLLGRLIEVWSGMRFDEYLRQAVLTPLEMVDTGFSVSEAKWDRFTLHSTGQRNKFIEYICWTSKVKRLAWTLVQSKSNPIQVRLCEGGKIRALGKVLA